MHGDKITRQTKYSRINVHHSIATWRHINPSVLV
nr:MAG TPA: hypothetical protein [Caudoviricetes sp.]